MDSCGPLLVLDPDRRYAELLRTLLERLQHDVEAFGHARELRARSGGAPGLVMLEVDLPDASGFEVCRELHDAYGDDLPVIFVAGRRTEPSDRVAGLLVGADDYIVKPFDPDELLARVRRSLRRGHPGVPASDEPATPTPTLTRRERQVLALLVAGRTQKEIGSELVISAKTVGTHIQHILGKLGVHSRVQAVSLALRGGLVNDVDRPTEEHDVVSSADAA